MRFETKETLVPAIVQDVDTRKVLMLGYMNQEAYVRSLETGLVTFFSRSKDRLWVKGETSGNHLVLVDHKWDCDEDTILIQAKPRGPVCHTGAATCWKEGNMPSYGFLSQLEGIIDDRFTRAEEGESYVASLKKKGRAKMAQKVGEEAVEVVIEAMKDDKEKWKEEAADLLFHFLVLLRDGELGLNDVVEVLRKRHQG
jgi:phosphoribosyl-ATP pyrophosphohydrolase/phosphoribosyl-AMP cyclohydrolase